MAHGHALEHGNLVAHHVLAAGHEALVDDLCRVVAPRVNVHALLDHRVAARPERLARLVAAGLDRRLLLRRRRACGRLAVGCCCHGDGGLWFAAFFDLVVRES